MKTAIVITYARYVNGIICQGCVGIWDGETPVYVLQAELMKHAVEHELDTHRNYTTFRGVVQPLPEAT